MILPKFELFRPSSIDEAVAWLSSNRDRRVKVLAGGTDLLVDLRRDVIPSGHKPALTRPAEGIWHAEYKPKQHPEALCALWKIPGLSGVTGKAASISIGAMTSITDLERSPIVQDKLGALFDGAYQLGSTLVRNRGTYGGNLCNARPAADTAIPTLALGGKLVLVSSRGSREVDHAEFTLAPGKTVIEKDEILTTISFDLGSFGAGLRIGSSYIKLAQRKSLEISVVGCATMIALNDDKIIKSLRVALGAVAPIPLLVKGLDERFLGKKLSSSLVTEVAEAAADYAKPISDHRASQEYRKQMVEVLVRRSLQRSIAWANDLKGKAI